LSQESNHDHEVAGKGFKHLTPTNEALKAITDRLPRKDLDLEEIPIAEALGRILGNDLFSPTDIPPFDRAAMDGFAVKAEDTYGASTAAPVFLRLVSTIRIGETPNIAVGDGEAAYIVTGGEMPRGASAVVMVEYTKQTSDGTVQVSDQVHPGENVSRAGEDLRKGAVVLRKGTRLLPQDIGMLSGLGFSQVSVKRKLRVAVLSTGNELQEGTHVMPGKIPDVNRPILLNAVRELGGDPIDMGIAVDEFDKIHDKLKQAIEKADLILVTAGTSVGPGDLVPEIINSLGRPGMLVHGVAMRPSMPTGMGVVNDQPVVSLPGYPVSAYIAFLEFVPPLMNHMLGTQSLPRPIVKARVRRRVAGVLGSRTYVRVRASKQGNDVLADPVRTSGAGILSSLVQANGFIIVPEHVEGYEEGQIVDVELFRPLECEEADN
jgi:molybdenum cofactor synthesis domain-containing protein